MNSTTVHPINYIFHASTIIFLVFFSVSQLNSFALFASLWCFLSLQKSIVLADKNAEIKALKKDIKAVKRTIKQQLKKR